MPRATLLLALLWLTSPLAAQPRVEPVLSGAGTEPLALSHVLRMATWNGARALGLSEEIGSVEAGKRADLGASPLESISSSRSIRYVVLGGDAYRPEELVASARPRP